MKRINLTACNLYKRMLKPCATRPKQSLVAYFLAPPDLPLREKIDE
jgi:hypothetical protein